MGPLDAKRRNPSQRRKFQLPKRLRGWHFLDRAGIPLKEHSGVLNQTGGVNIDKLKKVMSESLPEKVLKDIDSRSATKAPWQRKPFLKKKKHSAHHVTELSDEEDINAVDEEEE